MVRHLPRMVCWVPVLKAVIRNVHNKEEKTVTFRMTAARANVDELGGWFEPVFFGGFAGRRGCRDWRISTKDAGDNDALVKWGKARLAVLSARAKAKSDKMSEEWRERREARQAEKAQFEAGGGVSLPRQSRTRPPRNATVSVEMGRWLAYTDYDKTGRLNVQIEGVPGFENTVFPFAAGTDPMSAASAILVTLEAVQGLADSRAALVASPGPYEIVAVEGGGKPSSVPAAPPSLQLIPTEE